MKKDNFVVLLALLTSVSLFILSQPSLFFEDGLSFCVWFAYIPIFLLLQKSSMVKAAIYGAFYGSLSYFLLCHYLSAFGFLAISFVCALFALYHALLFFILSWSNKVFPQSISRYFWIFRAFLFLCFEFLRSRGIFGFSYGIAGYSQWKNPLFLKFSSLFGVMGVSLLIFLFNSLAAKIISEKNIRSNLKEISVCLSLFAGIALFYCLGFAPRKDNAIPLKFALIQGASCAPSRSIEEYLDDAETLKTLTKNALLTQNDTQLVVWPETAIVPDVLYHLEKGSDFKRKMLSENVYSFIKETETSFLIGNNHRDESGVHNSALFFSKEFDSVLVYNKNHLVPFTEFWPSFLNFNFFESVKESLNCELFVPGNEIRTFKFGELAFAVPICFEDSFAPLVRQMKMSGADFFVNISDDAWAKSAAAQKMHLSMSAFRCAEFNSPMLRSTVDGKTCVIDSHGNVKSEIERGIDSYLCDELMVEKNSASLYLMIGDVPLEILTVLLAAFLLILSIRFVKVNVYGR
ncbi:apolipoprotein N-acyltransferase [uncultured Treponema sp.]|uniref:apolipoprotein N-acyltransferase n=1 Tax=uncultured Treponema sp. TaxID=162155 RepID=UPI0025E1CB1F|nr:apolipoprotein N-acyltransferase [uncultured Treponema sp.]